MGWPLDERFRVAENESVLRFIDRIDPSAHSDVATELLDAAEGLPEVQHYCPDLSLYAYVVIHTRTNKIFGLAYGMNGLALRVGRKAVVQAVADGGRAEREIDEEWISLDPFRVDEPTIATKARLRRWCEIAYRYANEHA